MIEQFYKWSTRVCILSFVLAIVAFVATVYNGSNGSIIVSGLLAALYIIISGFILALLLRGFGELLRILGGIEDKMG